MAAPSEDTKNVFKLENNSTLTQNDQLEQKNTKNSNEHLEPKCQKKSKSIEEFLLLEKNRKQHTGPQQTFKPPPSSVLSQVKQFLPVMASENTKLEELLQRVPASDIDIEHVDQTEGPVIEMDIALGILNDSSSDDDVSDTESDSSDSDGDFTEKTETNLKLTKCKNKPPNIEDITEKTGTDSVCENKNISNCDITNDKEPHR